MTRTPSDPVPSTTDDSRMSPTLSRVLVLLFLSVFINYIDRSNLSIAAPLRSPLHTKPRAPLCSISGP